MAIPLAQAAGVEFAKLFHDDAVFNGADTPDPPHDLDGFFAREEHEPGATAEKYLAHYGRRGRCGG
ncbi:hypothetical protein DQ392_22505 [Streptomyces reniochalinae]|uniref:Uncharacterized protein n=1 Tax=Streptomyces reniochalinae TaxID=2250578 RepID=A0A367ECR4_9ACTN|nr:hypothetical protein DQ392_22505 [Streptomyces reniochalinae]